ncbi:Uncharacterised protein [Enterobacter ludwigii]|nr:Uncharacterised protein [Enterobacter ludwigii]
MKERNTCQARQIGSVICVALFSSFMVEGAEYATGARTVFSCPPYICWP